MEIKYADLKDNFFVLQFCGFLNYLHVGKGSKLRVKCECEWNAISIFHLSRL